MDHLDLHAKSRTRHPGPPVGGKPSSILELLQSSVAAHQQGEYGIAEKGYRKVLKLQPKNIDALQLLGVLKHQAGDSRKGVELLGKALKLDPANVRCHNNLGSIYNATGEYEKAEAHFRIAVEGENPPAEAWHNLGLAQRRKGDMDTALENLTKARELDPDYLAPARVIGGIHTELHQFAQAEIVFRDLLAKDPDDTGSANNLAYVVQMQGRLDEAEKLYEQAMAYGENSSALGHNMRTLLIAQGREEEARELFRKQLRESPDTWTSELGLALGLALRGLQKEAMINMEEILNQFPERAAVWNDVGTVLMGLEKYAKAMQVLKRATEIDPTMASAFSNLGAAYVHAHRHDLAVQALKQAVALDPNLIDPYLNLCRALRGVAEFDQANLFGRAALDLKSYEVRYFACLLQVFRGTCDYEALKRLGSPWECAEKIPTGELPSIFLDFLVFSETHEDHQKFFDLVKKWAEFIERDVAHAPLRTVEHRAPSEKLRIGWLSSDLRKHSVSRFLSPLMTKYDRDRFEFYCYSPFNALGDTIQTLYQQSVDKFTFVVDKSPREIAETIQADGVDILLELNGFTTGSRLQALAYKPAPVQMSWLGYPFTCGLKAIDHVVASPTIISPEGRPYLVEEPVNMPEAWVCFGKFSDVAISPGLPLDRNDGLFTFGTLNNIYKYTPKMIGLWAEVLNRVPNSRFMIVRPEADSYVICRNIVAEFQKHGVSPDRIYFYNNRKDKRNHLAYYNEIDLSLDTSPLTGGTTTCEAVWMGVPVVSLVGDLFHQRLSYSVLHECGLDEFCAFDEKAFVECAVEQANNSDHLRYIRQNLREVVSASALCDHEKFIYQFQEMLMQVAQHHNLR